jgi:hypothetical protein
MNECVQAETSFLHKPETFPQNPLEIRLSFSGSVVAFPFQYYGLLLVFVGVRFHCILVAEMCKPELKLSTCKCIPAQEIKLLNAMRDCCKTVLYYGWSSVWPLCLDKVPVMGTQQG